MKELFVALLTVVTSVTTSLGITPKVTHDGSRTGERVGYQSYCHPEQGFVIYENEKMPFKTDEGESVLWTQGDINCYKQKKLEQTALKIPLPTPASNVPTAPQQTVTHDGSRTGKIIDYSSLCEGKVIKVYENELVPYKRITGETIYTTQGDIRCYEAQITQLRQANSGQTNGSGQSQLVKVPCDTGIGSNNYGLGYTKEEADKDCQRLKNQAQQLLSNNNQNSTSYTPPSNTNSNNTSLQEYFDQDYQNYLRQQQLKASNQSCRDQATQNYKSQSQNNYVGSYGYGTAQAMLEILSRQYQQALADCDRLYPVN